MDSELNELIEKVKNKMEAKDSLIQSQKELIATLTYERDTARAELVKSKTEMQEKQNKFDKLIKSVEGLK